MGRYPDLVCILKSSPLASAGSVGAAGPAERLGAGRQVPVRWEDRTVGCRGAPQLPRGGKAAAQELWGLLGDAGSTTSSLGDSVKTGRVGI